MSDVLLGGMLRGGTHPSTSLLEAIGEINARFRVSFTPEIRGPDGKQRRPALWWVHEARDGGTQAEYLRQEAGRQRLKRLWALPRKELERRIATWWETEYMVAGLYFVAHYTLEEWQQGEAVLAQLRRGQALYEDELKRARLEATREQLGYAQAEHEMYDNPEFAALVRDVATDFYRSVSGGVQEQVTATLTKEPTDDVANGQPLGEPGHRRDREPGQHSDGSAGPCEESEVRAGGNGGGRSAEPHASEPQADGDRGDGDRS